MKKLCIYGCGGMGREIADLSYRINKWEEIVFVDDNIKSRIVDGVPVFTLEEILVKFNQTELEFIVTAGEPSSRKFLCQKLDQHNLKYINVIDPGFSLSRFSSVKDGTIIHTGATITVNVHIGKGCLINKHVVIGHDVNIGDYTVISPNASVGGDVNIGPNCYLGSGAIIRNGINIGENSIIGMGSVVLKDVEPNSVMVGNPAKLIRFNEDNKVFR
jgi:sugar O-acyltransferase (sialic acid O-acetyltransferase NeuD family)